MLLLLMVLSPNTSRFPRPFDLSSAAGPSTTVLLKLLGCFLFSPCNDSFRSADGAPFLSRKGGKHGPFSPFLFRGNPVGGLSTHNWRGATRSQLQAWKAVPDRSGRRYHETFLARALSKRGYMTDMQRSFKFLQGYLTWGGIIFTSQQQCFHKCRI